jgi:hypothetical protein
MLAGGGTRALGRARERDNAHREYGDKPYSRAIF